MYQLPILTETLLHLIIIIIIIMRNTFFVAGMEWMMKKTITAYKFRYPNPLPNNVFVCEESKEFGFFQFVFGLLGRFRVRNLGFFLFIVFLCWIKSLLLRLKKESEIHHHHK